MTRLSFKMTYHMFPFEHCSHFYIIFIFIYNNNNNIYIIIFILYFPFRSLLQQPELIDPCAMAFLQRIRSPSLSFIQTVVSLFLGGTALMSSYWCVGQQKVPKPLCTPTKHSNCIPVPGVSNSSNIQFFWETGDDRFVFPTFHTGLFITCEENIYTDAWGEKAVK